MDETQELQIINSMTLFCPHVHQFKSFIGGKWSVKIQPNHEKTCSCMFEPAPACLKTKAQLGRIVNAL